MKTLPTLVLLTACTTNYREMTMAITEAPAMTGTASALAIPSACPIYTPNGRDIDTPELPYDKPLHFGCGVDSDQRTYGLVTGDTGDLAILGGDREIGVYYAFDADTPLHVDQLVLDGAGANVIAYAAPVSVGTNGAPGQVAEAFPDARIPIAAVAVGPSGILLTLGHFDTRALQVAITWDMTSLFGAVGPPEQLERFYVNAVP